MKFEGFPKIPRLRRDIIITEKIDGTNAQVNIISNTGPQVEIDFTQACIDLGEYTIFAGSRKRWIQPGNDNFGFAKWVHENAETLVTDLGEGQHFGEWWGAGIQRRYDMNHKVFSLFNTSRWVNGAFETSNLRVVPVLFQGDWKHVDEVMDELAGMSYAAPGFTDPEGIVIYQPASRNLYKVTLTKTCLV
jgi:hypothetical protein